MRRRNVNIIAGMIITLLTQLSNLTEASEPVKFQGHSFPELGYAFNALEPYIDAQTMEIHYSKHYRAYYDNFMKAAGEAGLLQTPMEEIFAGMSKYPVTIRNNGGGYFNHTLFWEIMKPGGKEIPSKLQNAIVNDFGSWDAFKTQFENAAKTRFGSGWAWLSVGSDGKLFVSSTPNQDNPLMDVTEKKGTPVLALDVWEHAYYLKYQNRRAEYVENFWNVINWQVVLEKYTHAIK